MTRTIFIKEIIAITREPKLCPTCEKDDRLEWGIISEMRTGGRTVLCTRCEALSVVTDRNIRQVDLSSPADDTIMLKEPYLIRRVSF